VAHTCSLQMSFDLRTALQQGLYLHTHNSQIGIAHSAGPSGVLFPVESGIFIYCTMSRLATGTKQRPVQQGPATISLRVKRPERDLTDSLSSAGFQKCMQLYLHASHYVPTSIKRAKGKAISVTGRGGPWRCETLRLPHYLDSRLTDGGEVTLTCRWLPSAPGRFLVLISVRGRVGPRAIVRLEEFGQLKNPATSSGIEPATFRLLA
jgi:hypothetical protein